LPGEGHIYTVETSKIGELNVSKLGREFDSDRIMGLIKEGEFEELGNYLVDLFKDSLE
jgi:hypothetical protein